MTFKARPIAPFKIDILSTTDPSSFAAGQTIPVTANPTKTRASMSGGEITLPAGSHWRIEYSAVFYGTVASAAQAQFEIQFYDVTNSQYIGQSLWGTCPNQNNARKGRVVCCALILNSDISTSMTIKIELLSQVNMASALSDEYLGAPSLRIMELPA